MNATAKGYGSASQNIEEPGETNRVELPPCVLKVADHKLAGEVVGEDEKPVVRANGTCMARASQTIPCARMPRAVQIR